MPPKARAAKKAAAPAVTLPSSRTGVVLDPADPGDARIIARQVKVAHSAGRSGKSRDSIDSSRADLLKAFDEGAAAAKAAPAPAASPAAPGAGAPGVLSKSSSFLSRGSWSPTLTPPSRLRDGGGLLAGALVYTGVAVYLRYGAAGWKGWLKAKFLNQPMQGLPTTTSPSKGVPT
jgi:hypothetical protein